MIDRSLGSGCLDMEVLEGKLESKRSRKKDGENRDLEGRAV